MSDKSVFDKIIEQWRDWLPNRERLDDIGTVEISPDLRDQLLAEWDLGEHGRPPIGPEPHKVGPCKMVVVSHDDGGNRLENHIRVYGPERPAIRRMAEIPTLS